MLRTSDAMLRASGQTLESMSLSKKPSRKRRTASSRRSQSSSGRGLDGLIVFAVQTIAMVLVAAAWCAVFIAAVVVDAGRIAYAAGRRRPQRGCVATAAVWTALWRMHLQRFLGPPPLEVRSLNGLLALSSGQFEAATASIFRQLGYRRLAVVGRAGDYCVDIRGIDSDGRSVVIQCKRYAPSNKVGSREVQTFVGMATVHHRAERGIFVTTSSFTAPGWKIARQSRGRIELVDGQRLAQILAAQVRGDRKDRAGALGV